MIKMYNYRLSHVLLASMLLIVSIVGCKKNKNTPEIAACGVENPVENLRWLRAKIDEAKSKGEANVLTVTMFEYKGNRYFHYYLGYSSCWACSIYDCSGQLVTGENLSEDDVRGIRNISGEGTVIWGR